MRKKKREIFAVLLWAALFSLVAGCGGEAPGGRGETWTAGDKERVTVALWSDQLTEHYARYLQETFPEVEFEFYAATNSTDFYRFKEARGSLPDILTVRRFSLNDVEPWRDSLMDLSDTKLANTFHQSYLRSYTYSDGTVNWLPVSGEMDSLLVNKKLLEANDIPLPADYEEFVAVCGRLKELGIRPFRSNFGADYTCMEILQGLSVSRLTSQEGREWRQQYESGQTDRLSQEVWLPVFQRMMEFIEYTGIGPEDLEGDTADIFDSYMAGETAVIRATGNEAYQYGVEKESLLMPYFGENEDDNWYLTYPAFQVAAKEVEDPNRRQLIQDILAVMLGGEGQKYIANGQDMIAYTKGDSLELSPMLEPLKACMEDNRLYIRLASTDMFSCSREVVQGMINGEYPDAASALDAFNAAMETEDEAAPVAVHIDKGYSYAFDQNGGSPAASAVMNSLREELGTELLVGQSVNVAGDIAAGDYTLEELGFLTMGETLDLLLCEMTGEQMFGYLDYVLTTPGKRGSVINDSALYVSSGFEMEIRKTEEGYLLEKLTIDKEELDLDRTYRVAVLGNEALMLKEALGKQGITEYTNADRIYKQVIVDRLARDGKQLAAPTEYLTLQ